MKNAKIPHMPEHAWQDRVTGLCDWYRLLWYHVHDSRKDRAGFPDLVIVGPGGIAFAELKSTSGKVSAAQEEWYLGLRRAGGRAYIWRPEDWPEVQNVLKELSVRQGASHAGTGQ